MVKDLGSGLGSQLGGRGLATDQILGTPQTRICGLCTWEAEVEEPAMEGHPHLYNEAGNT